MRTAAQCMARATSLLDLATTSTDENLKFHFAAKAADWMALGRAVGKMEAWEARFIGEPDIRAAPEGSLLD